MDGQWAGQGITINATNLQVDAGSKISADGQGYVGNDCSGAGYGPGGGLLNCNNAGNGGSYGGQGGGPNPGTNYGSVFTPTVLGSGGSGGYFQPAGGAGGGAIRLVVSGTLTNNGTITANGAGASGNSGGGSGGSVYVTTGTITGSGMFTANGGSTGDVTGGGGGRIAIYYATNSGFNPAASMTANAGGTIAGQAGSLVFVDSTNNLQVPGGRLELAQDSTTNFHDITVENGATVVMDGNSTLNSAGKLTVTGNSTILLESKNNTVPVSSQWQGTGAAINAANVQVDSGSVISADGQGYVGNNCSGAGAGPGGGPLNCNNNGNGGSYGGQGAGPNPAPTYGSASAPTALGSGGSGGYGAHSPGGAGGGAIRLVVSGTLTDNGTITANGSGAADCSGGGSGGSIYVNAGTIKGNGIFTANGGASYIGGGGGRIAVYYKTSSGFNAAHLTANGGLGAGAGTVVFLIMPTIKWTTPAAITYGTALGGSQLDATASVPGTFTYTPAAGTVLSAGKQTLSVTFTPTNATDYASATASVTITVNKATPTISWTAPTPIAYGTALDGTQLNASVTVPGAIPYGTLVYSPAAGAVLAGGSHTLSVTFTPTDTADYATARNSVSLTVTPVTPTINWSAPASITYGTKLSGTQLNAKVTYNSGGKVLTTPGTLTYTPAAGMVLTAGQQTLSATFKPANAADFNAPDTATQTLTVNPATPKITWTKPAAITYGTALSNTQLFATASVPGTFEYSPVASTVLTAGPQTLSVTFTPTNSTDYTTATDTTTITVNQASSTTTITSHAPSPSMVNQAVIVGFSVTGADVPTGTVTVSSGTGGPTCTGTLSAGTGSCLLTLTTKGSKTLKASYAGDANFKVSSSATVTQVVQ